MSSGYELGLCAQAMVAGNERMAMVAGYERMALGVGSVLTDSVSYSIKLLTVWEKTLREDL